MTIVTKDNGNRSMEFSKERLSKFIDAITLNIPLNSEEVEKYKQKTIRTIERKEEIEAEEISKMLKLNALDNITKETPQWTNVASKILLKELYKKASFNRGYDSNDKYGDLYGLLKKLGTMGIYNPMLLKMYSREEIKELQKEIKPERDELLDYLGLLLLSERYLVKDYDKNIYELPQERWMIIAMDLMRNEDKDRRLQYVKEMYWSLSNLFMTVATPTLKSAGLKHAQYASCFVDTVEDSLRGIYDSNTDMAELSKNGAGLGVFVGSIRAKGSSIRGYKGVGSGLTGWLKQLDNTANTVNQLGTRKGSIAVYLQVWHRDIFDFIDMKLNTGDDSIRCHNLFNATILPDLFMEKVENRDDWYLMCPHEIYQEMGWRLEDFYDEELGEGSFREKYQQCVDNPNIKKERVPAIDLWKRIAKSRRETGTPYLMFIDEVNRKNPNSHEGIIRSSNLCTEIMQNMSPTTVVDEFLEEDGTIVIKKKSGDFVTCNLSSLALPRIMKEDNKYEVLDRVIKIQVRALDNVIDLNDVTVKQAKFTNQRYRAIGAGVMGHAQLLANEEIQWESDKAVEFVDKLHEKIAYLTIKNSMELAKEKTAYPLFEGSDWSNGRYFSLRGYGVNNEEGRLVSAEEWKQLEESVKKFGVRNGYLQAPAPTGSISVINGVTAGVDPIFDTFYYEEKKDYKVPVVAPDLNPRTTWFYKNGFLIDQAWSIEQNAKRQKHVDQSISFNLYIPKEMKLSQMLDLDLLAWKKGLKTVYYTRTQSLDLIECEVCQ